MLVSDEEFLKILKEKKISITDVHNVCHCLIPSTQQKDVPLPLYLQRITNEKYFFCLDSDDDIAITLLSEETARCHPAPYVETMRFLKRLSN